MFAGLLAGREIASLAEPQHHGEKAEMRRAVGDGVMIAAHRTDADAAEREDPGFHRGLADHLDHLAHIDARIEIGGIFERKMRHVRITPLTGRIKRSSSLPCHRDDGRREKEMPKYD